MITRADTARHPAAIGGRSLLNQVIAALARVWPATHAASDTFRLTLAPAAQRPPSSHTISIGEASPANLPTFEALQALQRQYAQQLAELRALAAVGVAVPPADDNELLTLGRAVAGLLPQSTRAALIAALRRARAQGRYLRVVLEAQPGARAALAVAWELLVLPIGWGAPGAVAADDFVFLQPDVSLVRRVAGLGRAPAGALERPLRVHAFAAAPPDAQPIDLGGVRAALAPGAAWFAGAGTLGALHARLHTSQPQIVHLLCHGEQCDTGRGQPRCDLLLAHADGRAQRVPARELGRVLAASRSVQLVMLQACHGGTLALAAGEPAADSVTLTLLRYGVPAVIAMQGEVGQPAAQAFTRSCYALLAAGGTIEQAVAAGRLAMRAAGGTADWSVPVLYAGSPPA